MRILKRVLLFANKFHATSKRIHQLCGNDKFCSDRFIRNDPFSLAKTLSLSENLKSCVLGTQVHGNVIKLGFTKDVFLQNNLIKMYSKCGVFGCGLKVFDEMAERNLVSWTLIVSSAIQNGEFDMGLKMYVHMTRNGLMPNEFAVGSVVKVCVIMRASEFGLSIHCFALKIRIEKNPFVGCSVLNFYAKLGDIAAAEWVFKSINSDVGCWNAMIGGYAQCGYAFEALNLVSSMLCKKINMDKYTFINALQGCSFMGDFKIGRQIHGLIIRSEAECSISVMNALIDMYVRNSDMDSAFKVFVRIADKDVISWNTLFGGFSENENPREIASLFRKFILSGIRPNHLTFSILFRQCGELPDLDLGLQLHCLALHFGFLDEENVTSSLIYMFCRCGAMEMARSVFDSILYKNITTWNELISGYYFNCCDTEVLKMFCNLWKSGVEVNGCTFFCILEACCRSENQQMVGQIHGAIIKSGFSSCGYICRYLIKSYAKFGQLDNSFEFFNGIERLDMTSWGAMISTLVHQGHNCEAVKFFQSLLIEAGEKPDEYILGSILNSCAAIGAYQQTKSVHPYVIKLGFDTEVFVASAVIDAYAKCGDIKDARMAFDHSFNLNDVIVYNTLIMAYAHHGLVSEAMEIFDKMKLANLQPSQATFVSVISACSHKGLVDQGCLLFKSIDSQYGMEPSPDCYGCLVDMLSRNGCLEDAKRVIEIMPFQPWPAIYRSLLSGCRIHGNKGLGEWAYKKLLLLLPKNDAAYVLLSKVYSEGGCWEGATKVRRGMTDKQVLKDPGYSWIETLSP